MQSEQIVTHDQRMGQLQRKQAMQQRFDNEHPSQEALRAKAAEEQIKQLTALDRLMRKEAKRSFNMVCEDEDGEFAIPVRVLRGEERTEIVKLIADLGIAGAKGEMEPVLEEFENLDEQAAGLVTDKPMADAIRSGKFSSTLSMEIIRFALKHTISLEEAGNYFRIN